jgi:hypothetical protein
MFLYKCRNNKMEKLLPWKCCFYCISTSFLISEPVTLKVISRTASLIILYAVLIRRELQSLIHITTLVLRRDKTEKCCLILLDNQ